MSGRPNSAPFFSTYELANDVTQATPSRKQAWDSLFNEASLTTLYRTWRDNAFLNNPKLQQDALFGEFGPFGPIQHGTHEQQQKIGIDQANKQYGLNLKPTNTNQITVGMAEYFQRQNVQHQFDQQILSNYRPNFVEGLGAGLGASFTDPAEFGLNLLPIGKVASFGLGTVGRLGESAAARWAARAAGSPLLENPWLMGAIEGGGQTALSAPLVAAYSKNLGRSYDINDALQDVAIGGLAGGILQGATHSLFGRKWHPLATDPGLATERAHLSFANGEPVDVSKTIDRERLRTDLETARRDITQGILKAQDIPTVHPDEPTPHVTSEALSNPEVQRHLSPLEKRLSLLNDQEGMRAVVSQHAENINSALSKWAELVALPKAQRLESYADIVALQNEVLSNVAQLNDLIPASEAQLPTSIPLTTQGVFKKDALTRLGTRIKALNDLALSHVDDAGRATVLKAEWNKLRTDLKAAETAHAQARTKGLPTADVHAKRIAELTPQLQHVETLLRASGEAVTTPELSLGNYIMAAMGGEVNPQLDAFLKGSPDSLDHPVYRVRKQIFDNVMRRLYETQQYLDSTEPGIVNPSKFPDNNVILQDVKRQLQGQGDNIDPAKLHEELFQRVNQEINQQKALGIFDQSQLDRFDKIEEQFKANVEKTDAIKKGAVQAQICALGGTGA